MNIFDNNKAIEVAINRVLGQYRNRALLLNNETLFIPLNQAEVYLDKLATEVKDDVVRVYDGFLCCSIKQKDTCESGSLLKVLNDLNIASYGEPLAMYYVGDRFCDACAALAGDEVEAFRRSYLLSYNCFESSLIYKPLWNWVKSHKFLWLDEDRTCLLMSNEAYSELSPAVCKAVFSPFVYDGRVFKVFFFKDASRCIDLYAKSTQTELDETAIVTLTSVLTEEQKKRINGARLYEFFISRPWDKNFVEVNDQLDAHGMTLKVVNYIIEQCWGGNREWYAVSYKDFVGIAKDIKKFADKFGCCRISSNGKTLYLDRCAFGYLHKLFITGNWHWGVTVIVDMKSVKNSKITTYDFLNVFLNSKPAQA